VHSMSPTMSTSTPLPLLPSETSLNSAVSTFAPPTEILKGAGYSVHQ